MSKLRRAKLIRQVIRKEMQRELQEYWTLPFWTRWRLGWQIIRGKRKPWTN